MSVDSDLQSRTVEAAAALRAAGQHVTPDLRIKATSAAFLMGYAEKTLRNWRHEGKGPTWMKLGGQPWYRVAEIVRWMDGQERGGSLDEAA